MSAGDNRQPGSADGSAGGLGKGETWSPFELDDLESPEDWKVEIVLPGSDPVAAPVGLQVEDDPMAMMDPALFAEPPAEVQKSLDDADDAITLANSLAVGADPSLDAERPAAHAALDAAFTVPLPERPTGSFAAVRTVAASTASGERFQRRGAAALAVAAVTLLGVLFVSTRSRSADEDVFARTAELATASADTEASDSGGPGLSPGLELAAPADPRAVEFSDAAGNPTDESIDAVTRALGRFGALSGVGAPARGAVLVPRGPLRSTPVTNVPNSPTTAPPSSGTNSPTTAAAPTTTQASSTSTTGASSSTESTTTTAPSTTTTQSVAEYCATPAGQQRDYCKRNFPTTTAAPTTEAPTTTADTTPTTEAPSTSAPEAPPEAPTTEG